MLTVLSSKWIFENMCVFSQRKSQEIFEKNEIQYISLKNTAGGPREPGDKSSRQAEPCDSILTRVGHFEISGFWIGIFNRDSLYCGLAVESR